MGGGVSRTGPLREKVCFLFFLLAQRTLLLVDVSDIACFFLSFQGLALLASSLRISEDIWFSSLFSAIAVFLCPPTNVLKILRSLKENKKKQEILTDW